MDLFHLSPCCSSIFMYDLRHLASLWNSHLWNEITIASNLQYVMKFKAQCGCRKCSANVIYDFYHHPWSSTSPSTCCCISFNIFPLTNLISSNTDYTVRLLFEVIFPFLLVHLLIFFWITSIFLFLFKEMNVVKPFASTGLLESYLCLHLFLFSHVIYFFTEG